MTKDVKISSIQMILMFTGFLLGSTAILNPSAIAYQDAWLANILAFAVGLILVSIYSYISILNPNKTLIEILRDNFGKYLGSLISLLYIWYFIHLAALVERDFGEFTVVTTYPETPLAFIITSIVVVSVFIIRNGLEVLARVSEILIPILILLVIFIFLLLINLYEVNNFLSFLERGLKPVFQAAFTVSTFPYGESVIFLMLFPFLNNKKSLFRVSYLSIAITGLVRLNITIRDLMVLGADMFLRAVFPPNITTRLIREINVTPLLGINLLMAEESRSLCAFMQLLWELPNFLHWMIISLW